MHDKKLYDQTRTIAPPGTAKVGDCAYIGTDIRTPHKRKKGKKLTEDQKEYNRRLASKRAGNEHGIGRMKRFQILAQPFRNPRKRHSLILKNIAGLANMPL